MEDQSLKSKAAKGMFWSGAGNLLTQVCNMLFGLVIARILSPEDYGLVGLLVVFTGLASALQESGLSSALINKKDASQLDYDTVFWFTTGSSLFLYILLFFLSPFISDFYGIPELESLGRLVFLGFVFSGIGTIPYVKLQKELKLKQISLFVFLATFLAGLAGVLMALWGLAYWGLALQSIGMMLVRTALIWAYSRWLPGFKFSFSRLVPMWKFGVKILVNRIVDVISSNLMTIFIGKFYSKSEVGYYNQASKWNYAAYSVLAGMVNGMAQPVLVQASDTEERLQRVFRKMFRFMACVSFPCMFGFVLIAPEFITLTITEKWAPSVPLLRILCFGGAFIPLNWMCNSLFLSRGKSGFVMWSAIVLSCIQLLVICLCRSMGIRIMTLAYVGTTVLWFFLLQVMVCRELRIRFYMLWKDSLPFCVLSMLTMLVSGFIASYVMGGWWCLGVKIFSAVLIYILLLRLSGARIYREMLEYAKGVFCKRVGRKRHLADTEGDF